MTLENSLGTILLLRDNGTDIDLGSSRINIVNRAGTKDIPSFHIKDKQARSVPIPSWVIKILIKVQAKAEEGCPFIFLTKSGYEIVQKNWHKYKAAGRTSEWKNRNMANNVLRDFKVRVRDAGIMATGKVTIHCLRKSWASNLANAGVPSNTLMAMGGWSNIETVLKYYLKSSDENEKKAVKILDRLMEEGVSTQELTINNTQNC